jgi:hypothetical protein
MPTSIIKFADDTTVIGLITNNDETAYGEEVRASGSWTSGNSRRSTPLSISTGQ